MRSAGNAERVLSTYWAMLCSILLDACTDVHLYCGMTAFPAQSQKMQALDRGMRMPRNRELEVVTGPRSTQAVSALVARLCDETLPEQDGILSRCDPH